MPIRPHRSIQKDSKATKSRPEVAPIVAQHGLQALPSELLTHVTATLDPKSLLSLGVVAKSFAEHVKDDHTWAAAYKAGFLKLSPEAALKTTDDLLLKRTESTWRKEYLEHWRLNRRFSKSRSVVISHSPVNGTVSSMILLPDRASVLASSVTYGVVSRSVAFTGKVLKGYLDAHGTLNGQGIGNPNVEFAPDVSAIDLLSTSSSGSGSAKVAWGFLDGSVAVTHAPKVMELGKSAKFIQCRAAEVHEGVVKHVKFVGGGDEGEFVASACARGTVKIWETKKMRCLWTGDVTERIVGSRNLVPIALNLTPPTSVTALGFSISSGMGTVAAGTSSGSVVVWAGFRLPNEDELYPRSLSGSLASAIITIIPGITIRVPPSVLEGDGIEPTSVFIQPQAPISPSVESLLGLVSEDSSIPSSPAEVHIGIVFASRRNFWKLIVTSLHASGEGSGRTPKGASYRALKMAGGPIGEITSFETRLAARSWEVDAVEATSRPSLPPRSTTASSSVTLLASPSLHLRAATKDRSFVLAGDSQGAVTIWDWDAEAVESVQSKGSRTNLGCRTWTAHEDGGISALTINGKILVTGSTKGSINIWDLLTTQLLRSFPPPVGTSIRLTPLDVNDPNLILERSKVSKLILNGDVLVSSIGSRVFAWKADMSANKTDKKDSKGKRAMRSRTSAGGSNNLSRWQEQVEIRQEVREMDDFEADHSITMARAHGRERDQRDRLGELGLSEVEAVEYVLMLSRDEELGRREYLSMADSSQEDNFVFEMTDDLDFESGFLSPDDARRSDSDSPISSRRVSQYTSGSPSPTSTPSYNHTRLSTPTASPHLSPVRMSSSTGSSYLAPSPPPGTSTKIQISPRVPAEPVEAGGLSVSPLTLSSAPSTISSRTSSWQVPKGTSFSADLADRSGAINSDGDQQNVPSTPRYNPIAEWMAGTGDVMPSSTFSSTASNIGARETTITPTNPRVPGTVPSNRALSTGSSTSSTRSWSAVARSASVSPITASIQGPTNSTKETSHSPSAAGNPSSSTVSVSSPPSTSTMGTRSLLSESLRSISGTAQMYSTHNTLSEEEELQYVLQLSLAEAQSRGEA